MILNRVLIGRYFSIPSFRLMDNSVHLHACSLFCVGIFHSLIFLKSKLRCLLFYVDMLILIGKALMYFYML